MQIAGGGIYAEGHSDIWADPGEGSDWSTMPTPVPSDDYLVGRFAGSGGQLVVSAERTGVFTTSDMGVTYHRIGIAGAAAHALAVDESAAGETSLLAGTEYSVRHRGRPGRPRRARQPGRRAPGARTTCPRPPSRSRPTRPTRTTSGWAGPAACTSPATKARQSPGCPAPRRARWPSTHGIPAASSSAATASTSAATAGRR